MKSTTTRIVLLIGLPGSGKGTLAAAIVRALAANHISCGDAFRREIALRTEFGKRALEHVRQGTLTPDDDTTAMFLDYLREHMTSGVNIVEGYPRSREQLDSFHEFMLAHSLQLAAVIHLFAPEVVLLQRLAGRQICPTCGAIYNDTTRPPERTGVCDTDGTPLARRQDDADAAAATRLRVYSDSESAVVERYEPTNLYMPIDASQDVDEVLARSLGGLADRFRDAAPLR